jgi:hypothetical protein
VAPSACERSPPPGTAIGDWIVGCAVTATRSRLAGTRRIGVPDSIFVGRNFGAISPSHRGKLGTSR